MLAGIFAATGQTCIAGSRLLVQRSSHDELVERIVARAERDPARRPARRRRPRWGRSPPGAARAGARLVDDRRARRARAGRRRPAPRRPGAAAPACSSSRPSSPTSRPTCAIAQEEVFGPVLAVIAVRRRGRGPADRQRDALRPRRRRLDRATSSARTGWPGALRRRHRLGQHLPRGRAACRPSAAPGSAARPRERRRGGGCVHQDQERLGRAVGGGAGSLRPARLSSASIWGCSSPASIRPAARPPLPSPSTSSRSASPARRASRRSGPASTSCRSRFRCSRACRCWPASPRRPAR